MPSAGPSLGGTASGWTNPNNALSSTDAGASATMDTAGSGVESSKLLLTNFGFALPGGSMVTKVEAIVGYNGAPIPYLYAQILLKIYLTKDAGVSYGSSPQQAPVSGAMTLDVWDSNFGLSLSAAEVNGVGFGVGCAIKNDPQDASPPPPAGVTYYLDYLTLTISYAAGTTGQGGGIIGSGDPGSGMQTATETIFRSLIIR